MSDQTTPTPPDDTDPVVPEGWELRSNGTVLLHLGDGQRIRLRRPKLGEFRKLREASRDMTDDMEEFSAPLIAEITATEDAVELRRLNKEHGRTITERWEEVRLGWIADVVALLGDKPLPATDDLPAWATDATQISDLTKHWQTAPPHRGVR